MWFRSVPTLFRFSSFNSYTIGTTADTVALLLSHRAISPNGVHPPGSGSTPLHLAASLGRVDIVNLLLEQDSINDTLRDAQGRGIKDVARGKDVVRCLYGSFQFSLYSSHRAEAIDFQTPTRSLTHPIAPSSAPTSSHHIQRTPRPPFSISSSLPGFAL